MVPLVKEQLVQQDLAQAQMAPLVSKALKGQAGLGLVQAVQVMALMDLKED